MADLCIRDRNISSIDIPESSLKWKLDTYSGTETQTFYIITDSDYFFLIQIAYSTMSCTPSAQITLRLYAPDGNNKLKTDNFSGSDLVFSSDKMSIKSPTLSYQLESKDPIKYKISQASSGVELDITFEAIDRGFQVNDGKLPFNIDDDSWGYVNNWFVPKGRFKGYITIDGLKINAQGFGSFVYACQSKPQSVGKWNFLNFQSKSDALLLYQVKLFPLISQV